MQIISNFYAILIASIYMIFYVKTYKQYFPYKKYYIVGVILLLFSVYIQFLIASLFNLNIGLIALISFISYPISISFIYKTNIFNILFLSFNIIVKIYIMFLFFGTLYAFSEGVNYDPVWIKDTPYFGFSQGHAYLISIGSLYLADVKLLKNKLKDFFQLKRNLISLISIQLIVIINVAWLSFTDIEVDLSWYNSMLLITSFSFEIIYFLLRLFTANSSFFSSYMLHTVLLEKQLQNQIEHYKSFEEQVNDFKVFKHDHDKVLTSIDNLLLLKQYDAIEDILKAYRKEIDLINSERMNYSNNLILDALLNDYAKRFIRIETSFKANTFIKINQISDLNLIKLFYNILENAYEALLKVPVNYRSFEIVSEILENYVKISFVNTTINESSDEERTTKSDKLNHGFGKSIINEILLSSDGFVKTYINQKDNLSYYNLEIYLPLE